MTHSERISPTPAGLPPGSDQATQLAADLALARRVCQGEMTALHDFADRLRCVPRILTAKNAMMGRPLSDHDLADLVQDTMVVILSKLHLYNATGPLEGWIFRICSLEFMNGLRRRRSHRTTVLPDELSDPAQAAARDQLLERERIQRALANLDPTEAEAVQLKHFDGITFQEMADRLGVSANTLKARYYRGMQQLEQILSRSQ